MDITPLVPENVNIINGYGPGFFKVNNNKLYHSLIVSAECCKEWVLDNNQGINDFNLEQVKNEIKDHEILLIGTGIHFQFSNKININNATKQLTLGVEFMDSMAACRTYNILISEGRKVLAALICL